MYWLDIDTSAFVPAPQVPVQVHIEYTRNMTTALATIDVLTDDIGRFIVGQFLFPEDLSVGPNTTYNVYAEVTEMFLHNYSVTDKFPVEVRANTTVGFVAGQRFRSDEQPLKLDFKVHYTADYERGIFDNRLTHAPVSFTTSGGLFGCLLYTSPSPRD